MELVGTAAQQKPEDPGDPTRRDDLYAPKADALRGSQDVHARASSTVLRAQKLHPGFLLLGIIGAGIAVAVSQPKSDRV
jgi:hypothetical protein